MTGSVYEITEKWASLLVSDREGCFVLARGKLKCAPLEEGCTCWQEGTEGRKLTGCHDFE